MDAKSVYQSIVEMLFNSLKNEKTRTNILLDIEFKLKIIDLVNNLLSLEVDHEATFKDKKWSTDFAKAIVNISKEKIKFEKPENKSVSDCYADYAALLTYCLNTFEIDKSVLTSNSETIEADKIKEFKVTEELKTKYSNTTSTATAAIEVVDDKVEKPNTDNFTKSKANSGFESFGQGAGNGFGQGTPFTTPIPPMQDPRFYPYKSKPKYMKYLKIALGATFGLLGAILILISILSMYLISTVDIKPLFEKGVLTWTGYDPAQTSLGFSMSIFIYLGFTGSMSTGVWLFVTLYGFMIAWITYNMVAPVKRYKDQYVFPLINIIAPGMLIIFVLFGYFNADAFKGMTGELDSVHMIIRVLEANKVILSTDQEKIQEFYTFFSAEGQGSDFISSLESKRTFAVTLLWLQFALAIASIIFTFVVIMLNPKLDRQKVMYANNEFQTMINEALQGRKHEIDPSIYEDQAEIDAFYQKIKDKHDRKQNRNKEDN